jgi:hypothetical protein
LQVFATTTLLFKGALCSFSAADSPPNWLDQAVIERFNHSECQEERTWIQISEEFLSTPWLFSSGGLGPGATRDVRVWACWQGHPCLVHIAHASQDSDSMCYVYHETEKTWLPWCLGHELSTCSSQQDDTTDGNSTSVGGVNSTDGAATDDGNDENSTHTEHEENGFNSTSDNESSTHGPDFNTTSDDDSSTNGPEFNSTWDHDHNHTHEHANSTQGNSSSQNYTSPASPTPIREPELTIPVNVTLRNLMRTCGRQGASMCPSTQPYAVDGLLTDVINVPSWRGDLIALSGVSSVSIHAGDLNGLIKGTGSDKLLSIYVGNSVNATDNQPCVVNMTAPWPRDITCTKPLAGRFIHVVASGSGTSLSMTEVQVFGWRMEEAPSAASNCGKGYGYNSAIGACERCPIGWTTDANVSFGRRSAFRPLFFNRSLQSFYVALCPCHMQG